MRNRVKNFGAQSCCTGFPRCTLVRDTGRSESVVVKALDPESGSLEFESRVRDGRYRCWSFTVRVRGAFFLSPPSSFFCPDTGPAQVALRTDVQTFRW